MTEAEWLTCDEPRRMLDHLRGRASDRGLWLFVSAACGRASSFFPDEINRTVLAISEAIADQTASPGDVTAAREAVAGWKERFIVEQDFERAASMRDVQDVLARQGLGSPATLALRAARWATELPGLTTLWRGWDDAHRGPPWPADPQCSEERPGHMRFHAALLRDLFNPFRPVAPDPGWLTANGGAARNLAAAIDDGRAFERLPILADALEDAGCTDRLLLGHCRGPGLHVRGCWALDLVLGKS
jgi:hypothetical protein